MYELYGPYGDGRNQSDFGWRCNWMRMLSSVYAELICSAEVAHTENCVSMMCIEHVGTRPQHMGGNRQLIRFVFG